MTITVLLLIAGLALVLLGAEGLVEGSSSLARRWGVSEFVIGLTIVAMGTSAPEMVVSFIGAVQGNADISVGNVIGSNIFNTALILGLSAVICPIAVTPSNIRRDVPLNILSIALLAVFWLLRPCSLPRWGGVLFILIFGTYMFISFKKDSNNASSADETGRTLSLPLAILFAAGGLAALIFGGRLFVNNAEEIAKAIGWSDKFIAITVLAAGTSLPELATSVVAAAKGKGQLALGNILGSNIFNILLILGVSAVITPLNMGGMTAIDFAALAACALIVLSAAFTGHKGRLDRWEGVLLLLVEAGYMAWLIVNL